MALHSQWNEVVGGFGLRGDQVRLAWHDSGTYDQRIKDWPQRGGANGAIRFDPEMNMGANAGPV